MGSYKPEDVFEKLAIDYADLFPGRSEPLYSTFEAAWDNEEALDEEAKNLILHSMARYPKTKANVDNISKSSDSESSSVESQSPVQSLKSQSTSSDDEDESSSSSSDDTSGSDTKESEDDD